MRRLVPLLLVLVAAPCFAELHPREVRRHLQLSINAEAEGRGEASDAISELGAAEVTVITREWYEREAAAGTSEDDALRAETIVLVELQDKALRLRWEYEHDYRAGTYEMDLRFWDALQQSEHLALHIEGPPSGADLGDFMSTEIEDKPRTWQHTCRFACGGREWDANLDDWLHGRLDKIDRELLEQTLDDRLVNLLQVADAVGKMDYTTVQLCAFITAPLLGHFTDACLPVGDEIEGALIRPAESNPPDCEFDMSFAEPCTDEQLEQWRAQAHRDLTEPVPGRP